MYIHSLLDDVLILCNGQDLVKTRIRHSCLLRNLILTGCLLRFSSVRVLQIECSFSAVLNLSLIKELRVCVQIIAQSLGEVFLLRFPVLQVTSKCPVPEVLTAGVMVFFLSMNQLCLRKFNTKVLWLHQCGSPFSLSETTSTTRFYSEKPNMLQATLQCDFISEN